MLLVACGVWLCALNPHIRAFLLDAMPSIQVGSVLPTVGGQVCSLGPKDRPDQLLSLTRGLSQSLSIFWNVLLTWSSPVDRTWESLDFPVSGPKSEQPMQVPPGGRCVLERGSPQPSLTPQYPSPSSHTHPDHLKWCLGPCRHLHSTPSALLSFLQPSSAHTPCLPRTARPRPTLPQTVPPTPVAGLVTP